MCRALVRQVCLAAEMHRCLMAEMQTCQYAADLNHPQTLSSTGLAERVLKV